ncbi:MAG: FtsX-like permease family protein [Peptostreptococcaceae bacterium]
MFKIFNLLSLSFSQLSKRSLRTFINIFSISIGVVLIVTMLSLGIGIEDVLINKVSELNNLKHITVKANEYQTTAELSIALAQTNIDGGIDFESAVKSKPITKEVADNIDKRDEVEHSIRRYNSELTKLIHNEKSVNNLAISSYEDNVMYLNEEMRIVKEKNADIDDNVEFLIAGEMLTDEDTNSILLPEFFVINTLGFENISNIIGAKITLNSTIPNYDEPLIFNEEVTVKGVVDQRFYQPSVIVTNDLMKRVKDFDNQNEVELIDRGYDIMEVSVSELDDVETLSDFIELELKHSTESVKTVASTINSAMGIIKIGLSSLGIIVMLVSSLGVVNTMIMSIHERVRYIGLMRSSGATKFDIQRLFLTESFVIGALGGILGVILTDLALYGIRDILAKVLEYFEIYDMNVVNSITQIDVQTAIIVVIFTAILTVISGIYPSIKASKLNPIEAIRHD